ncbi:WhiB family transcriptional regulator [Micromonospora sp. NPDC023814]|uniref:WhiB family transcriptional regulator n=1 Tax=Micromonospora sp. NPDC023814 TaxID=3154596 RepID=UPI0033E44512
MSTATLTRRPAPSDSNWRLRGLCLYVDPDTMHPDDRDRWGQAQAKDVCKGCPVAEQCLDDANRVGDFEGIRAGLTGKERRALDNAPATKPCHDCGEDFAPRTGATVRCTPCARTHHYRRTAR